MTVFSCKNVSSLRLSGALRFPQRLVQFCQDRQDDRDWNREWLDHTYEETAVG
jgi:hypothetical protein